MSLILLARSGIVVVRCARVLIALSSVLALGCIMPVTPMLCTIVFRASFGMLLRLVSRMRLIMVLLVTMVARMSLVGGIFAIGKPFWRAFSLRRTRSVRLVRLVMPITCSSCGLAIGWGRRGGLLICSFGVLECMRSLMRIQVILANGWSSS